MNSETGETVINNSVSVKRPELGHTIVNIKVSLTLWLWLADKSAYCILLLCHGWSANRPA